jgi:hypothetical protein
MKLKQTKVHTSVKTLNGRHLLIHSDALMSVVSTLTIQYNRHHCQVPLQIGITRILVFVHRPVFWKIENTMFRKLDVS